MTNSDRIALYQQVFDCKDANSHEGSWAGMIGKSHSRLALHSIRKRLIYLDIESILSTNLYPIEAQFELSVSFRKS
ncbi:hypothetical protein K3727_18815 [Rhodobacteraceae bacterium M382]|nr:hypothetical protein K3727_18815 [Rhodobacteraceae bacterium M382]